MDAQGGLTRRRGAGITAESNEDQPTSRVTSPTPQNNAFDRTPETGREVSETGHIVAYDPRDMSESAERSKQPKLTLMEEILLLGLKDRQVNTGRIYAAHVWLTFFAGLPLVLER
jgi:Golgi phosphoprotein 3